MSSNSGTPDYSSFLAIYGVVMLVIILVSIVFSLVIWWRIFSRAGYSGALSLLMFVPIGNLIVLLVLAFGEWPIYQELNMLRQQVRGPQQPYPSYNSYPQGPQPPQFPSGANQPGGPQYPQY
ncbi:DUF805 domain-containing protein [Dictyobacter arantiisoli]|uniref:DUF805 domain-containing protein n=1 Tax=Dictyobacter arantiisoli TaxID=2014874 RepID=A0A5A5T6A8_9CHLR|nr:DUF805 domain-containing protein [Dictyobacter arantiisoli]GCF06544.1 hypothetical protein KDI_01080 [Dictyobacter arantiisoli]